MTDKELYAECKKWGKATLQARWKFEGLLPEVNRRKLYEKKGFDTIYDFARILAGVSRNQVNRVLQLDRKFEDKPELHQVLTEGKVSVNKLARVASIVTVDNQGELAQKVQTLSKAAVDVFVKEYKGKELDGLFEADEVVPVHNKNKQNFDFEIINAMSPELKTKIKELMDKGHDINQILLEMLAERDQEIDEEMRQIELKPTKSRYINVKTRHLLSRKFGTKCGKSSCAQPTEHIHHEKLFAIYHSHDPKQLKPLCRGHHELEHQNDFHVQKFRQVI